MAGKMFAKLVAAAAAGALVGAAVVATAAPEFNTRGSRFKPLAYAELTPDQRAFAERELAAGRKPETGPFNIYLRSPEMAELSRAFSSGHVGVGSNNHLAGGSVSPDNDSTLFCCRIDRDK